jgi:hypothetical protein
MRAAGAHGRKFYHSSKCACYSAMIPFMGETNRRNLGLNYQPSPGLPGLLYPDAPDARFTPGMGSGR